MKKSVLVLMTLLVLLPAALLTAKAPADPVSLYGNCTSHSQCPTGQLCCNLCGNPPDDGSSCLFCTQPVRGRCPLVL